MYFILQTVVKIIFVLFLAFINYVGVKEAGIVNDILTITSTLRIFSLNANPILIVGQFQN